MSSSLLFPSILHYRDIDYIASAVSAVFSLAHKLQPAIIFIDEVDSFLGQRRATDHEAMTNMKTEFMSLWDGFTTDRKFLLSSFAYCHDSRRMPFVLIIVMYKSLLFCVHNPV